MASSLQKHLQRKISDDEEEEEENPIKQEKPCFIEGIFKKKQVFKQNIKQ